MAKMPLLANSNQSEAEKYYRLLHVLDYIQALNFG